MPQNKNEEVNNSDEPINDEIKGLNAKLSELEDEFDERARALRARRDEIMKAAENAMRERAAGKIRQNIQSDSQE